MNHFHLRMKVKHYGWNQSHTARYFGVSIGLVSENLRLFKRYEDLINFRTRELALKFYK
jgi:hypothetical protein